MVIQNAPVSDLSLLQLMSLNEVLEGVIRCVLNLNVNQVAHNKLAWDP